MKKLVIVCAFIILIVSGCYENLDDVYPISITNTDFNLLEANELQKDTWKSVYELVDINPVSKLKIKSIDEFYEHYDFSKMPELGREIFYSLIERKNGEVVTDTNGYIILKPRYIPTVYDNLYISKAYIRESIYEDKYSDLNIKELIIEEHAYSFYDEKFLRVNIYRKNNGEWILYKIEGSFTEGMYIIP